MHSSLDLIPFTPRQGRPGAARLAVPGRPRRALISCPLAPGAAESSNGQVRFRRGPERPAEPGSRQKDSKDAASLQNTP